MLAAEARLASPSETVNSKVTSPGFSGRYSQTPTSSITSVKMPPPETIETSETKRSSSSTS